MDTDEISWTDVSKLNIHWQHSTLLTFILDIQMKSKSYFTFCIYKYCIPYTIQQITKVMLRVKITCLCPFFWFNKFALICYFPVY